VPKIELAVHWIRENATVLALSVAVLTFAGGTFGGIGAAVWYLSTLATTDHVNATVREALGPLHELKETVDSLDGTVSDLRETVAGLEGLRRTVDSLETSVWVLGGAVEALSGMVGTLNDTVQGLDDSVDALDEQLPPPASSGF